MSGFFSDDPNKPGFIEQAPAPIRFLFDKSKPKPLRYGIIALLAIIFFYPLFSSKRSNPAPTKPAESAQASPTPVPAEGPLVGQIPGPEDGAVDEPDALEAIPVPSTRLLKKISGPYPVPVEIRESDKKRVSLVSAQDLYEVQDDQVVKKLDAAIYETLFNSELPPLTAAHFDAYGDLWLGSSGGQIVRYSSYDWKISWAAGDPILDKILSFARKDNMLFIGTAKGLWKWDIASGKLSRLKGFDGIAITVMLEVRGPTSSIYLGSPKGIFRLTDRGWEEFFAMTGKDRGVLSMVSDENGGLYVGTEQGLMNLSAAGVVTNRSLTDLIVTSVTLSEAGRLWVGTQAAGLLLSEGKKWYAVSEAEGLDGNFVSQVLRASDGQLWIGITGKGVFHTSEEKALEWFRRFPKQITDGGENTPKEYRNACKAALTELKKIRVSGELALEMVDGQPMVFIRGRQACPAGIGFRQDGGQLTLLKQWELTILNGTQRRSISIPKELPADQASSLLVDSQNRVWIGFSNGAALLQEGNWTNLSAQPEFAGSAVQAIAEDSKGGIWIGTAPVYTKESQSPLPPNLHRFDGATWSHFGADTGVPGWTVSFLLPVSGDRMAIGTANGFGFISGETFQPAEVPKKTVLPPAIAMSEDQEQRLWMAHVYFQAGVSTYEPNRLQTFDTTSGLLAEKFSNIAHDANGRHWLVATSGRVSIYPAAFFSAAPTATPIASELSVSEGNGPSNRN